MQLEVYEAAIYSDTAAKTNQATEDTKGQFPKLDPIVIWLALFVFGGGLLALYYAGLGYFPEVSWQDALTHMALMTIIGGGLLVAYSFLLFVPGAIWRKFLIDDTQLKSGLLMRSAEPCVWSVTKRILFPFALFMTFCHFLLFLREDGPSGFVPVGAAASLIAVSGLLVRDFGEGLDRAPSCQLPQAGAISDSRTLWLNRGIVGATHSLLLLAFIGKVRYDGDLDPRSLCLAALLPLATSQGLYSRIHVVRAPQRNRPSARIHPRTIRRIGRARYRTDLAFSAGQSWRLAVRLSSAWRLSGSFTESTVGQLPRLRKRGERFLGLSCCCAPWW